VKLVVQRVSVEECRQLVDAALKFSSSSDIRERCNALAQERFPDLLVEAAS
jgi:signal transduction protein with GAF and PtsI domain